MPKDYSLSQTNNFKALRTFTDREGAQLLFWKQFNQIKSQAQNVLYFYGVGGIGKTALLNELRRQLRGLPHARVAPSHLRKVNFGYLDFQDPENRRAPSALFRLRETMVEKGNIELPIFDIAYTHYYARHYHQELPQGLKDLASKIGDSELTREILFPILEEAPWLSKLFKTGNLFMKGYEMNRLRLIKRESKALRLFLFKQDPSKMTHDLINFFAADLRAAFSDNRPIVLFLDTYEAVLDQAVSPFPGARLDRWIIDLAEQLPGVLLVIAGRRKISWGREDPDWIERNLLKECLIGELAEKDARIFLEDTRLPQELIQPVLDNYHGLPFFLDLALDLYERSIVSKGTAPDPEAFTGTVPNVISRFLSYLDPSERAAVKVLSATRSFDYEIFDELMSQFSTAYPQDKESYQELLKYSLFAGESEHRSYVHQVVKEFLKGETQQQVHQYLLSKAEQTLNDSSKGILAVDFLVALDEGFYHFRQIYSDQDAIFWLNKWTERFQDLGRYDLLYNLLQEAKGIATTHFGPNHSITLSISNNVAIAMIDKGLYEHAMVLLEHIYAERQESIGPNSVETLSVLGNLAYCTNSMGLNAKALILYKRLMASIASSEDNSTSEHLFLKSNMGMCLEDNGYLDEALLYHREAYEGQVALFGDTNPKTQASLSNLAHCLDGLGRSDQSLPLHQRAMEISQAVNGNQHPHTLIAQNNYGLCLENLGQHREAWIVFEDVYIKRERLLGINHPHTIDSINNFAHANQTLGSYRQALKLFKKAVDAAEALYGIDSVNSLLLKHNVANCLSKMGRLEEALQKFREVYKKQVDAKGNEHPDTVTTIHNMAACLCSLGRFEEGLVKCNVALKQRIKSLGETHMLTLSTYKIYADLHLASGQVDKALLLYTNTLMTMRRELGTQHPYSLSTHNRLINACQQFINVPMYKPLIISILPLVTENH